MFLAKQCLCQGRREKGAAQAGSGQQRQFRVNSAGCEEWAMAARPLAGRSPGAGGARFATVSHRRSAGTPAPAAWMEPSGARWLD
jgi:hypothetical protein